MKKPIIAVFILLGLFAAGYFGYGEWNKRSPAYSLEKLYQARVSNDTVAMSRYYDAERIFSNMWPRLKSQAIRLADERPLAGIDKSIFTEASAENEWHDTFIAGVYSSFSGRELRDQDENAESITSYLIKLHEADPTFVISEDGRSAVADLLYSNYASIGGERYPTYNLKFVFEQRDGGYWALVDIQGLEDWINRGRADAARVYDVADIGELTNQYLDGEKPLLTTQNMEATLEDFSKKTRHDSLPTDPLAPLGRGYTMAVSNGDSIGRYEYIIRASLSSIDSEIFRFDYYLGLSYADFLKKVGADDSLHVLGLDCTPPYYCYAGWGNESQWHKSLWSAATSPELGAGGEIIHGSASAASSSVLGPVAPSAYLKGMIGSLFGAQ